MPAIAFELEPGMYFFDNTKLKFSNVTFIIGSVSGTTRFIPMRVDETEGWFRMDIDEDISNVDNFCFVDAKLAKNTIRLSLDSYVTQYIDSKGTRRTAVMEFHRWMSPYSVFYPLNDNVASTGYWRFNYSYNAVPSRTLPIVHVNTRGGVPIVTKEYYIEGSLWIDNCESCGFANLGSMSQPLSIQVKGRGNCTWNSSFKKPYKIKFATKQTPLGLDKSKHFILKPDVYDYSGYLRNETGFEMSRQLGMPYTTRQYPVEVMLNGEYAGMYFLCEKIRVEGGRVDIVEQQDMETDPDNVTGGWLLELGYEENQVIAQFENNDPARTWFAFMSQSPEELSPLQRSYIHDFMYRADSCIFVTDKNDRGWERYFDISTAARFYVIHEMLENVESYSGSLYLYKDLGWNEKLKFGPVWDFDNSYPDYTAANNFIYNYNTPFSYLWIRELVKFPRFMDEVKRVWTQFVDDNVFDRLLVHAAQWRETIATAEQQDKLRWQNYASGHWDTSVSEFIDKLTRKKDWLTTQWYDDSAIESVETDKPVAGVRYYNLQGVSAGEPFLGFNIVVTTYTDGTRSTTKSIF